MEGLRELSTRKQTKKKSCDMMKLTTLLTLGITFAIVLVHSTVSFLENICKFTLRADAPMYHLLLSVVSASSSLF